MRKRGQYLAPQGRKTRLLYPRRQRNHAVRFKYRRKHSSAQNLTITKQKGLRITVVSIGNFTAGTE